MYTQAIDTIGENLPIPSRNARKQVIYFLIEFIKVNEVNTKADNAEAEKITSKAVAKKGKAKKTDSLYSWLDWR
jgi:hypothetical protein